MRSIMGVTAVLRGATIMIAMGWDRFILGLAVVIAITTLLWVGKVDSTAGVGILSAIGAYVFGAGHESVRRDREGPK